MLRVALQLSVCEQFRNRQPKDTSQPTQRRHARVRRARFALATGGAARFDELQLILRDPRLICEGLLRESARVPQLTERPTKTTRAFRIPHTFSMRIWPR